jgi:hypothetical protein
MKEISDMVKSEAITTKKSLATEQEQKAEY